MTTKKTEKKQAVPEKPKLTEQDIARKHNHAEINRELDNHFNGSDKEQKSALANVETAFNNLAKVK